MSHHALGFKSRPLPQGTRVARPELTGACWGAVETLYGRKLVSPRTCANRARGGRLTCQAHRRVEDEAQALKASLEGGK